ncbi:hypothetical protein A1O1_02400 [Capronia coronata CBS 617.96]|uniref:DHHA2 domain-containing protein n=1 Tax=Capronia coronata CBS 617.96 TaxID=1182541 RepID=W9YM71_9EURO|nr:uncharacterized protein A1O1_02400 [Capronia coronata CBS 617.96]EXJ94007.1 hypothetical protein A1O1_02400 [Capronia coronata CBS 617.96]
MPSLSSYLANVRRLVFQPRSSAPSSNGGIDQSGGRSTLVMGNPSADLDSFVSAVLLSYFYNLPSRHSNSSHPQASTDGGAGGIGTLKTKYVPVLNLPAVKADELWRLRPEFGVALRWAVGEIPTGTGPGADEQSKDAEKVKQLEDMITVADIKSDSNSVFHSVFADSAHKAAGSQTSIQAGSTGSTDAASSQSQTQTQPQSLLLVDHNAPSIPGMSDETIRSRLKVIGCIDHHVDEGYVEQDASPRIITTGIGSCTSLVVKHLRDQGMWPTPSVNNTNSSDHDVPSTATTTLTTQDASTNVASIQELSKLALAPILIDTTNLTGKGDKCSDTDREAVAFLEAFLSPPSTQHSQTKDVKTNAHADTREAPPPSDKTGQTSWDRTAFYNAISTAKANSLNLLTMQETFDRDYKVWQERTRTQPTSSSSGAKDINVGISSLVKPLSWLIKHAGGVDKFLDEVETFATAEDRKLGVFAMLTRAGHGKEMAVFVLDEDLTESGLIGHFEDRAGELQLREWDEDRELMEALNQRLTGKRGWKVWWIGDTSKSRKQVGPLLREAVKTM